MVDTTKDWRAEFLNDNNFEQNSPFDYDLCYGLFCEAAKDMDNLNPFYLLRPIWEITKAFKALSTALSVGFSDITSKVQVWREIYKLHYSDCNSMQEILQREEDLKVHNLNGSNNSKQGHKKNTKYYTYISGARHLLRLTWFLDFFNNIFKFSIDNPNKGFDKCIGMAYDKALAPNHPWLVRQGAWIGINMAPSKRAKAMVAFGLDEAHPDTKQKIENLQQICFKLWEHIHGIYVQKGWLKLE